MSVLPSTAIPEYHFTPPRARINAASMAYALLAHLLLFGLLHVQISTPKPSKPVTVTVEAELWSAVSDLAAQGAASANSPAPKAQPEPEPTAPPAVEPEPATPSNSPTPAIKEPAKTSASSPKRSEASSSKPKNAQSSNEASSAKNQAQIALKKREQEQAARQKAEAQKRAQAAQEKARREKEQLAQAQRTAIEQQKAAEKQAALEKQAKERLAKEQAAAQTRKAVEAQKQIAQQKQELSERQKALAEQARKEQLARMQSALGAGDSGSNKGLGPSVASNKPTVASGAYPARVRNHIRPYIVYSGSVAGNPRAEVEVRSDSSGRIVAKKLLKPSGNAAWDSAVLSALDKAGTLPKDIDGSVPPVLTLGFRPIE